MLPRESRQEGEGSAPTDGAAGGEELTPHLEPTPLVLILCLFAEKMKHEPFKLGL